MTLEWLIAAFISSAFLCFVTGMNKSWGSFCVFLVILFASAFGLIIRMIS